MNVSEIEFQNMKEAIVTELIALTMENRNCSLQESFDLVYNSRTFKKLSNAQTGLYFQSARYVYAFLAEELQSSC